MKITRELLQHYYQGTCTEEERFAVEQWLASPDDQPDRLDKAYLKKVETDIWESLSSFLDQRRTKVVPLYQQVMRYVAAACFVVGVFMAGYFYALQNTGHADTIKKGKHLTDLLYIYGNDSYGTVAGSKFRVKFEGTIRLHNSAPQPKHIMCGNQEFTLEPHRTYFLSGSDQSARITSDSHLPDTYDWQSELAGGFSVRQLD